jgi:hypothetical protein
MKLLNILTITFFILLIISCNKEKQIEKSITDSNKEKFKKSEYFDEDRIKDDKYNVKTNGSDASYGELELYYKHNNSKKEDMLPYSLMMVEKHKKFKYASDVFEHFLDLYTDAELNYNGTNNSLILYLNNIKKLNSDQKNYLLYYLKLGVKNRSMSSIRYMEILNRQGIGVTKNIQKADSLNIILNELKKENHMNN